MSLFIKFAQNNTINAVIRHKEAQVLFVSYRKLSIVPSVYDGEQDPAPKFFSSQVQVLLKRLTRPDFSKVFRKRTSSGLQVLKAPTYKFLTSEELDAEIARTKRKANRLLQMPPVVKVELEPTTSAFRANALTTVLPDALAQWSAHSHGTPRLWVRLYLHLKIVLSYINQANNTTHKPINDVLSQDPALIGYDTSTYLFTDISFGVDNVHRIIVQRDLDGTLRKSDHDIRKRLNQVYFPINGRKIREPLMFSDAEKFNNLLDREEYEFALDRACIQYEPDEPKYQEITSVAYQHVDAMSKYQLLRSTRHFGPLTFYLTWHQSIDNLMLELLQNSAIREAVLLTALTHEIHGDVKDGKLAQDLVKEILQTPVQLTKPEILTEEDIQLDSKCVDIVAKYIISNSSMKSQQELALQGFRESYQELVVLSRGLKKAHGNA